MRFLVSLGRFGVATALALSLAALAHAQVTPIGSPFLGNAFEDFESFPNYITTSFVPLANPTSILGGTANLTGTNNLVYEPSAGATWGLGGNGSAGVADGTKALGLNNGGTSNDGGITFLTSATDFGGFFGNVPPGVTLRFFDSSDTEFYSEVLSDAGGTLTWHGWSSTTPIKRIAIEGDSPVIDSLRANVGGGGGAAAPEPGTVALVALGLVGGMIARRRK